VRVLFISYNGLGEPLGRSQVLPYIRGLAKKGHRFVMVSFEKPPDPTRLARHDVQELLPAGTAWIPLSYHQRPTLPATAWDILRGVLAGLRTGRPDVVHARGTVAASIAAALSAAHRAPWVFDVRGLLAQEYVDAGRWPPGGVLDRLTRAVETTLLRRAHGLVFLTHRVVGRLRDEGRLPMGRPVAVISCAVDLERFAPSAEARVRVRRDLGLGDEPLMVYAGSLGSWYLHSAMLDFLEVARTVLPGLRFLVLTPQPCILQGDVERRALDRQVIVRSVSPSLVPDHLGASDFGISFISPSPSKIASSPTKLAEYLACGLPVVVNEGVGDVDTLAGEASWIVVRELAPEAYREASLRVREQLAAQDRRESARNLAVRRFALAAAIDGYDALYREVGAEGRP
jgi:glycosyltransferase involved in cell wall biosynthesis